MKTIAFHLNSMGERGTELSTFNYAFYNQKILKNKSIIIAKRKKIFNFFEKKYIDLAKTFNFFNDNNIFIFNKRARSSYWNFAKNFKIFFYDTRDELDQICKKNNVDFLYVQKFGTKDDIFSNFSRNLNHVIFMTNEKHGYKYLYISEWLSKEMTGNNQNYVPYIVNPSYEGEILDLRKILNISRDKIVIASYGGKRAFDIDFVKSSIVQILKERSDLVFLFMNYEKFYKHKNIIYLPRSISTKKKIEFIKASDCMLHGRLRGETFGLAVAEFSFYNKPILCYFNPVEKAHLDILKEKAITYSDKLDLMQILRKININSFSKGNFYYDCYSKKFSPNVVMKMFEERFLK